MELGGTWRAAPADEALRRVFTAPDFEDAGWGELPVPGHWRSSAAFADCDGPVLYRRGFEAVGPGDGRRSWLTLHGLFYDGDVWLDGSYVGATEGYFFPHTFEVSTALAARPDHMLAVEVGCTRPSDRTAKRALTGVFQHWDCLDPAWNPGGIWRPVAVHETGPIRMANLRVLCAEATAERAQLDVRTIVDAAAATSADVRITIRDPAGATVAERTTTHTLAHGENRIRVTVTVEQPALWWPHSLGDQPLHDVTVEVVEGGLVSDVRTVRTGLRQVRMKGWIFTVNGERLFLKGSNHGPTRMALAEASAADLEGDVVLAKQAGLDLLRIHAHITRPELYEAADRHGLLLWQDLPLQWGYARGVRKQAVRQAREAVDLLGHHPSIAVWCGHNEPLALDVKPGELASNPARLAFRVLALQELPTWNKTVLDTSIGRSLERSDPTRPVLRHSGLWPGPVKGGTDAHLYFGWYNGVERDFPRALATIPNLARFVTEFGAQAVPTSASWIHPERWPDLDWDDLEARHALQKALLDKFVPAAGFATFEEWREASQEYQATVIRYHIETLRRLKYRPSGGFCHFCLADAYPGITWSVLDHLRVAKAGYRALAAACAPVIIVADRPAETYPPGAVFEADVHVVSDLRRPLTGVLMSATLGERRWLWEGDVPADSCVRVGRVETVLPATAGRLTLALALEGSELIVASDYPVVVGGA